VLVVPRHSGGSPQDAYGRRRTDGLHSTRLDRVRNHRNQPPWPTPSSPVAVRLQFWLWIPSSWCTLGPGMTRSSPPCVGMPTCLCAARAKCFAA
jgi:hypothetical protein